MAKSRKKPTGGVPLWVFVVSIVALIGLNLVVYFGYFAPLTKDSSFYAVEELAEAELPGFIIHSQLSDTPQGELADEISLSRGEPTTFSVRLEPSVADAVGAEYLVRTFEPASIPGSVVIEKGRSIPEGYFEYREGPLVAETHAILASNGYVHGELVPLYYESGEDLVHDDRMLFFASESREVLNRSFQVNYKHKIMEGLIAGPEMEELIVDGNDVAIIEQLSGSISSAEVDLTFDKGWIPERRGYFSYTFTRAD